MPSTSSRSCAGSRERMRTVLRESLCPKSVRPPRTRIVVADRQPAPSSTFASGRYWVRTSDLLLVRAERAHTHKPGFSGFPAVTPVGRAIGAHLMCTDVSRYVPIWAPETCLCPLKAANAPGLERPGASVTPSAVTWPLPVVAKAMAYRSRSRGRMRSRCARVLPRRGWSRVRRW